MHMLGGNMAKLLVKNRYTSEYNFINFQFDKNFFIFIIIKANIILHT